MEPENDPYRHAYLKAKATTNGIMHALFNWWLAFTLFNLVVVSLFLWAYDPIGRLMMHLLRSPSLKSKHILLLIQVLKAKVIFTKHQMNNLLTSQKGPR